jgi:hypothetical protein
MKSRQGHPSYEVDQDHRQVSRYILRHQHCRGKKARASPDEFLIRKIARPGSIEVQSPDEIGIASSNNCEAKGALARNHLRAGLCSVVSASQRRTFTLPTIGNRPMG